MGKNNSTRLASSLLSWYHQHKRDLPWRQTHNPYAIWLSEMMLQQTQVTTVIPYFQKFLEKFPSIGALAEAPLQQVLKSWEGLGYYTRARHLHSTAREVCAKYGGKIPNRHDVLLSLPGIGAYTAAAIASIAFDEAVPVVDGNVLRVFSRVLADDSPPEKAKKNIAEFLAGLIPPDEPGSFNQAMMELGSLVCTVKNPKCALCPIQSFCRAYKLGKVLDYPRKAIKKMLPAQQWIALAAVNDRKILLRQRPLKGIWGGLWELPSIPNQNKKGFQKEADQLLRKLGTGPFKIEKLRPVKHTFSHFKLTIHPFLARLKNKFAPQNHVWANLDDNPYPMPAPYVKLLASLKGDGPEAVEKITSHAESEI